MWMVWVGVAVVGWAVLYVAWSAVGAFVSWFSDRRSWSSYASGPQSRFRDYLRDELSF